MTELFRLTYNHRPEVVSGVLEDECDDLLRSFFRSLRKPKEPDSTDPLILE